MSLTLEPSVGTMVAGSPARERATLSHRWLALCWLAVLGLGALQAWNVHWALDPDGVAYLDMGDAFFQGNWRLALNGLWPPLYPGLIGLSHWLLRTPPSLEIPLLHGLNLLIYLAAYAGFLLLIGELIRHQPEPAALSNNAWLVLGTAVFIWAALTLATIPEETPDMLAAVFIFVAFACLLRIHHGQARWGTWLLLGTALALSYLAKYFMFDMAFVFLAVALVAAGPVRRAAPRVLLALATFLLVSSPFIVGLSWVKGRLTTNDSAGPVYLFHINQVPFVNWQGGPPGTGTLIHPTRQLYSAPAVYEYATPVSGTYPPWDDPDYWMAGGKPLISLPGHLTILLDEAAPIYVNTFVVSAGALLAGCLILFALAGGWRASLKALAGQWVLLGPSLAALALFAIIHVETRYIVAFAPVLWLGILAGVRWPTHEALRPIAGRTVAAMALVTVLSAGLPPAITTASTAREWLRGRNPQPPDQWTVASALHAQGIAEQDKIAFIGNAFHAAAWARLARVQIVAEIPQDQDEAFWALDDARRTQVIQLMAGSGAHVLVTKFLPSTAPGAWQRLGQTDYYVYWLR